MIIMSIMLISGDDDNDDNGYDYEVDGVVVGVGDR